MESFIVYDCLWVRQGAGGIPQEDSFWSVLPPQLETEHDNTSVIQDSLFMLLVWGEGWEKWGHIHPFTMWFTNDPKQDEALLTHQHGDAYSYLLYEKVL